MTLLVTKAMPFRDQQHSQETITMTWNFALSLNKIGRWYMQRVCNFNIDLWWFGLLNERGKRYNSVKQIRHS